MVVVVRWLGGSGGELVYYGAGLMVKKIFFRELFSNRKCFLHFCEFCCRIMQTKV